jgi:mono/diheme cytochrome c family protein
MRSWTEGVLAIIVVVALGAVLFLFGGGSIGGDTPDTTTPIDFDADSAVRGQVLAGSAGCLACHTIDGTPSSGPTWKGLAGSSRPLTSGESVIADDTYLFNSIVDPSLQVVQGFDAIMSPDYGDSLSNDEITDLVNYIKSLAS